MTTHHDREPSLADADPLEPHDEAPIEPFNPHNELTELMFCQELTDAESA